MHTYHCRESKISEQEKHFLPYRPKPIEKYLKSMDVNNISLPELSVELR